MLQVQKRKKGPRRGWMIWAGVGIAALGCALFAFLALREEKPAVPKRVDTGGSLVDRETAEISRVRISMRGEEPWSAVRNEAGELTVEGETGWAIGSALGENLQDALANVVYENILTEDAADYQDRLAEFGLAEPELVAEVTYQDGNGITLRFGDRTGGEDDLRYMTVDGDPRLYAAAGSLMEDLRVEKQMLHRVTQPEIQVSRMDRITVRDGAGDKTAEWALDGEITDGDAAANWTVTWPVSYPADQDQMSSLKKNAGNLRLGLYVGAATAENLAACGLDRPRTTVEIHLAAGATGRVTGEGVYDVVERDEETVFFVIGAARNDMTDYCLFGEEIYTINHFTLQAVAGLDPVSTAARYPVIVPLEVLSRMEIRNADGTGTVYELSWGEGMTEDAPDGAEEQGTDGSGGEQDASGENSEEKPAFRCTRDGEEISATAFEAAYARLQVVDASGRLPEGWIKQETEVTYVFSTTTGRTHTLELSPFDAMHDCVTVDGCSLFYLIRGGMTEMP